MCVEAQVAQENLDSIARGKQTYQALRSCVGTVEKMERAHLNDSLSVLRKQRLLSKADTLLTLQARQITLKDLRIDQTQQRLSTVTWLARGLGLLAAIFGTAAAIK